MARGSASLAHSLKMTAGFVGDPASPEAAANTCEQGYRHDHVGLERTGQGTRGNPAPHNSGGRHHFSERRPDGIAAFDEPMPPPTPDGRTGRVPAGCVFWVKAAERTFSTVPEDHGNCSVGRLTHGMATLDDVSGNSDVGKLLDRHRTSDKSRPGPAHPNLQPRPRHREAPVKMPAAAKAEQTLSAAGLQFIAGFEGFSPRLYNDPGGHCTIGYGHLVHRGRCNGNEPEDFKREITREQGLDLLRRDTKVSERAVNQQVQVVLTQYQFDALVSFVFNVGAGAFGGSTLLRRLNQGEYKAVPAELMRWVNSGGRPLPGLVRRRQAEGVLFSRGAYGVVDAPTDADISESAYAIVDAPADSDMSEVERNDERANAVEKPTADH